MITTRIVWIATSILLTTLSCVYIIPAADPRSNVELFQYVAIGSVKIFLWILMLVLLVYYWEITKKSAAIMLPFRVTMIALIVMSGVAMPYAISFGDIYRQIALVTSVLLTFSFLITYSNEYWTWLSKVKREQGSGELPATDVDVITSVLVDCGALVLLISLYVIPKIYDV